MPSRRDDLTIGDLAKRTGMTVRNIRAHQSRGLLPAPEIRGRTGYYGPEHVARLRLITEMQAEGFNLKAIERLLDASDGAGEQILDFGRVLLSAFGEEEPEFATADDLERRLGGPFDEKTIKKAEKLGLVRPLGDGRFELPAPTLIRAGEALMELGVPVRHTLAVAETIDRNSRAVARAFVRLFAEDVMGSADGLERTPAEWARLREALERLQPLAADAVRTSFQQTMGREIDRQLRDLLQR
jgi:DNA-binding transcriptional MerR regulator